MMANMERMSISGESILLFENPTCEELKQLLEEGQVKGVLAPRDRLIIWQASCASHAEIIEILALNKFSCIDLDMLHDGPVVRNGPPHYQQKAGEYVEMSAAIQRLYGTYVTVQ